MKSSNIIASITISSSHPTYIFEAIKGYIDGGYVLVDLWYKRNWFWGKYYAKLSYDNQRLSIDVGPIQERS